jgi:hypothetical protein
MNSGGVQGRRSDLLSARALLDAALIGLCAIEDPEVPLLETRSYVSAALAQVYEALAHANELAPFREHSSSALQLARDALTSLSFRPSIDPNVYADLSLVAQAIGQLSGALAPVYADLRLPRGEERPPLRASVGEPTLHDVERTVLHPTVPLRELESVAPPAMDLEARSIIPPPTVSSAQDLEALAAWGQALEARLSPASSSEEADDEPEAAPAPVRPSDEGILEAVFGKALPAPQVVWLRGKSFFEDIAMMSLMRQAGAAERWTTLEVVEQRMLARVDALLACGTWIFPRLVQLLEDRPVPDPELTWAALFVLGSIDGDDSRDQIARLVHVTDLEDEALFEALADALSFAPHRGIETLLQRFFQGSDKSLVRLSIRVLSRRRALPTDALRPLLRLDDPIILREVLEALERAPGELDTSELTHLLMHPDEAVFRAAAECATARGLGAGIREAKARLASGRPCDRAALLTAVGADEHALEHVLGAAASSSPSRAIHEALGWYGSIEAVPFLLGRLRDGDEAAVLGLQRITGASLSDEDRELPTYAEDELPFVRTKFVAPRFVVPLSLDADRWAAWWERYGRAAEPRVRYRWGHRWSTRDDLYELRDAVASPDERRLAYLELCARTGGTLPFDAREFVVRQRAQVDAWAQYLGPTHERARPGTWPVRFLR